jgi:hypothetical protein
VRFLFNIALALSLISCAGAPQKRSVASENAANIALVDKVYTTPAKVMADLFLLQNKLFLSSAYPDANAVLAKAKGAGGAIARAADLLANEKFEVATALSEARRLDVLKAGFLNYRQIPLSANEGAGTVLNRDTVEGNYIGITNAAYGKMDAALKPKSAYLKPLLGSDLNPPRSITAYGGDHYIFKTAAVRNRTTFTPGDSFNRRNTFVDAMEEVQSLAAWDQVYTPWVNRAVLIPFLSDAIGASDGSKIFGVYLETFTETYSQLQVDYPTQKEIERFMPISGPADKSPDQPSVWASTDIGIYNGKGVFSDFTAGWGDSMDYIEAQIWGALGIDDVAAFEFTQTPPSGPFLTALKTRGIQIRDARKQPVAVWTDAH